MIRDDLALAVRRALDDAALPEPPKPIVLEPPKQRGNGDWATPVAMSLSKPVGEKPMAIAERIAAALARGRGAAPGPGRGRPARLREPLPRAHLAARRVARGRRRRRPVRDLRRARRAADQPRVRLRQPDRAAPRRRRALGRGRRRHREPARLAGRRGAPRVLPERHRQPARDLPRLADGAVSR